MTQPQLKRGEVLNRYETLYFQPAGKIHGTFVTPPPSNHHNSTLLHGKKKLSESYHSLGLWEATTQVWDL